MRVCTRTPHAQEMIALVRERLVEILHTKEGARATMQCIWHGRPKVRGGAGSSHTPTPGCWLSMVCDHCLPCPLMALLLQDRKVIVKSFKGFVKKISKVRTIGPWVPQGCVPCGLQVSCHVHSPLSAGGTRLPHPAGCL